MTNEETALLRRKWEYQNKWRTFGNVMGKMEGFGTMDLSREGTVVLYEGKVEYKCALVDRTLEVTFPTTPDRILRLRISELTADKLVVIVSLKTGDKEDKSSQDLVELYYAPTDK